MKKVLIPIILGFTLFLVGLICFSVELRHYDNVNGLVNDFSFKQEVIEKTLDSSKIYRITNSGVDTNIEVYIDNNLKDKMKIFVSYPDIVNVFYKYKNVEDEEDNYLELEFESKLELNFTNIKKLVSLGVSSFNNKINYDYSLIEYPKVRIYINEQYKNNIELVGRYGNEYKPIR